MAKIALRIRPGGGMDRSRLIVSTEPEIDRESLLHILRHSIGLTKTCREILDKKKSLTKKGEAE